MIFSPVANHCHRIRNRFVKPRRLGLRWIASRWVPALNQEKLEQYQNVLSVITLLLNICQDLKTDNQRNQREFWEYMTAVLARVHSSLLSEELTSTRETDRFAGGEIWKKNWQCSKKGLSGIIRYKDYKDKTAAALCPSILASESSCPSRNQLQRAHNLHTIREKWTLQKEI